MTVKINKPAVNLREELNELKKPTGVAGEAMLRAETPQEQFNLIGAGRRNMIINGGFDVWQRGTTQTSQGFGSADRWFFNLSNCGGTITKQYDAAYGNYAHYTGQSNSGAVFYQGVELANGVGNSYPLVEGKTYTFSFMYKSTARCRVMVAWRTNTGSGTSSLVHDKTNLGGSGDWEKISFSFVCTSPLSTANVLQIQIFDTGIFADMDIAQVQLELGKVATPFEHRSYGEELALCQRYYYQLTDNHTGYIASGYQYGDTGGWNWLVSFPVQMRVQPTLTGNWTTTGNFTLYTNASGIQVTNLSLNEATLNNAMLYQNLDAGDGGDAGGLYASNSAQLAFNSEL